MTGRKDAVPESHPIPGGVGPKERRSALVAELGRLLDQGGVRRLSVALGGRIHVVRAVERPDDAPVPVQPDLVGLVQQAEMSEVSDEGGFLAGLVRAWAVMSEHGHAPTHVLVGRKSDLAALAGVDRAVLATGFLGLKVHESGQVPPGTVLIASVEGDEETVEYAKSSVRIPVEVQP